MKFTFLITMLLSLVMSVFAFADTVKQARSNDLVDEYVLKDNGDFFRNIGKNKCQITDKVKSFKVSSHPQDAAMVYFEKGGDLFVLHNADAHAVRNGNCPKASKKPILENIDKYNVVSNTDTTIVNMAVTTRGHFVAWENSAAVASADGVESYVLNECYGVKGKGFSSYVAFLMNKQGWVFKLKGQKPGDSKWDESKKYDSLQEFKRMNNVCN